MNPTKDEVSDALNRLDRALESPRILAAKAIAEYRGEVKSGPWINRSTGSGAPVLNVDQVESSARPAHAPNMSQPYRRRLLLRWLRRRG